MLSMDSGAAFLGQQPSANGMQAATQANAFQILAQLAFDDEPSQVEYADDPWHSLFFASSPTEDQFFDALDEHDGHDEHGRMLLKKFNASGASCASGASEGGSQSLSRVLFGVRGGDQPLEGSNIGPVSISGFHDAETFDYSDVPPGQQAHNVHQPHQPHPPQYPHHGKQQQPPPPPFPPTQRGMQHQQCDKDAVVHSSSPPPPPPYPPASSSSSLTSSSSNLAGAAQSPQSGEYGMHAQLYTPEDPFTPLPAPPVPKELPLRFLRAGKGDPVEGQSRFEATVQWRKETGINSILQVAHPNFDWIKQHYPHYYHLRARNGAPVFYERPPKTDLAALKRGGVDLPSLLRHYAMVTEFQWQYVERDDFARSITVIDLEGMRMMDFVGDCVEYVKKCSAFTGQHYPERAGCVLVINVPGWFKMIWNVVKPMVDEVTLAKIRILRGKEEIFNELLEQIPIENIPPEYGGQSMPLGQSPQEVMLRDLMCHNNQLAKGDYSCGGRTNGCPFCSFRYARSY